MRNNMQKTLIWDLPTRLFHWLLVVSLLAQYATAEWLDNAIQWHFYIGYFTLFLVVFRIMWGVAGTQYAKFSSFVTGPGRVINYLKTLFDRLVCNCHAGFGSNTSDIRLVYDRRYLS